MGDIGLGRLAVEYWHVALVAIALAYLAIDFLVRFVWQSRKLSAELVRSLGALRSMKTELKGAAVTELEDIATKAMSGPALSHLWQEYVKTLHPQKTVDDQGQMQIRRWRSTALAETFFTEQAVVDSRLKTEFFKHLPGVLTGLGILGTFLGLIKGLVSFDVSLDPGKAQDQLRNLVNAVGHAFFVSATAIGLAMVFTFIEKWHVTARYRQVEELRELIDGFFTGGAGEEYLERLANSSENAATQSSQIKDALVADLKEVLTTLAHQQIESQARHANQMSVDVSKTIADSLSGPMESISRAVQGVSANQGDAVNKMLTDVLSNFSAQIRETFGGQMEDMSKLIVSASESMQNTAASFKELAANMNAAGTNTVDEMGERLARALEAMDARQAAMNDQTGAFVEQIRALVAESQTESSQQLKETLSAVGGQVADIVEQLRRQAEQAAQSQGERSQRFEQATGQAVGSLSEQVERLLAESAGANSSLRDTVERMAEASDKAISGMNSGAQTLQIAANDFADAGRGVADTMRASTAVTEDIKTASAQLSMATDGARSMFADYAKTRDVFATMVSDLKSTIETAKRDASMTSELVARIEAATRELGAAQKQSEEYLHGVTDVLVSAHEVFRNNVERALREGNRQFQAELSTSVSMLSSAIKNLGDAVEDIPVRR